MTTPPSDGCSERATGASHPGIISARLALARGHRGNFVLVSPVSDLSVPLEWLGGLAAF